MPPRSVQPKEIHPGPGQIRFAEVAETAPLVRDLDRQNVFAEVATPQYWDLDLEKYSDVTPQAIAAAAPERLKTSLIGLSRSGQGFILGYTPDGQRSRINIALTPAEFTLAAGSIDQLGSRAVSNALRSRPRRADFVNDDAASQRAGVHAVEKKKDQIVSYTETLADDIARIEKFQELAFHPGLRRSSEGKMREEAAWLLTHVFGDMLLAIRHVRNWSPEQAAMAEKTVNYRLFLDRTNNRHLGNWRDMLALADSYYKNKRAVFNERASQAQRYIDTHQPVDAET